MSDFSAFLHRRVGSTVETRPHGHSLNRGLRLRTFGLGVKFRLVSRRLGPPAHIPHRFWPETAAAQFPHNRTIPHRFFFRSLPIDATKSLHFNGIYHITIGIIPHRAAIMSTDQNPQNGQIIGSIPTPRTILWKICLLLRSFGNA